MKKPCLSAKQFFEKLIDTMKSINLNFRHFLFIKFDCLSKESIYLYQMQCCTWQRTLFALFFLSTSELSHLTLIVDGFLCHNFSRKLADFFIFNFKLHHGQCSIWQFMITKSCHNYRSDVFSSLDVIQESSPIAFEPLFFKLF